MDLVGTRGAARALAMVRALRATIVLACGATAVVAWTRGATTLLGLAIVIAVEETWETSVVVSALRRQLRGVRPSGHRA